MLALVETLGERRGGFGRNGVQQQARDPGVCEQARRNGKVKGWRE